MQPAVLNLTIFEGATFTKSFQWLSGDTPVNLTGCTAKMQIRARGTNPPVLLELTTENNRISITGAEGRIVITLPASVTNSLAFYAAIYDLKIIFPGNEPVYRLLEGAVTVKQAVTE